MTYLCKNCNAPIEFNPDTGFLECKYCLEKFRADEYENFSLENVSKEETMYIGSEDEYFVYKCSNCGAEVLANKDSLTAKCMYCGTHLTLTGEKTTDFRPEKIVPFKVTQQEALNHLKKYINERNFIDENFVKNISVQSINGYFLPFYLFNSNIIAKEIYGFNGWPCIEYEVTATTRLKPYAVNASNKINVEIADTISKFNNIVDYQSSYMLGFMAERAIASEPSCYKTYRNRTQQYISDSLCRIVIEKETNNDSDDNRSCYPIKELIETTNIDGKYTLLPFYIITFWENGKLFKGMVNGETGETAGVFPVKTSKYFKKELLFYIAMIPVCAILASFSEDITLYGGALISPFISWFISMFHTKSSIKEHMGLKEKYSEYEFFKITHWNRIKYAGRIDDLKANKELAWKDFENCCGQIVELSQADLLEIETDVKNNVV